MHQWKYFQCFSVAMIAIPFVAVLFSTPGAAEEKTDAPPKVVNVYSYRQPFLVEPLFRTFEEETGIVVNVLFAKQGLIERIALEGRASPADILLTTDIGQMFQAAESVSQIVRSSVLTQNIPIKYRDPDGRWFALTKRVRAFFVARDEDDFDDLTYEDLGSSDLGAAVCIKSGQHSHNIALIAAMIAHHGSDHARSWLEGMKENLARRPRGTDRLQVKGVSDGDCQIAVINTYYIGKMITNERNPDQAKWARSGKIIFPRFQKDDAGTHVNFSGMVMMRFAPNKDNALKLMEFLSSTTAQRIYAADNFEFAINPRISVSPLVRRWGVPEDDGLSLAQISNHRGEASLLVDETGFNN